MTTLIPFHSSTLPPGELAAVLAEVAARPETEAQLIEGKGTTMLDPATTAMLVSAGATVVAGLLSAVATVWAARIAARKPAAPAAPQLMVIVVETQSTTLRVVIDPADPAGSVAAAPLPAAPVEVVGVRLETGAAAAGRR